MPKHGCGLARVQQLAQVDFVNHPKRYYYVTATVLFLFILIYHLNSTPTKSVIDDYTGVCPYREASEKEPFDPNSKFTIVMATYNRLDLYKKAVEYYANLPNVDRFILVWNNVDLKKFPLPQQCEFNTATKVIALPQPNSQIQNRYNTASYIRTSRVLNVDDDLQLSWDLIQLGWNLSLQVNQLVGYGGRIHIKQPDGSIKYSNFVRDKYSMLIGAAFWAPPLFYDWYWRNESLPTKIRNLVVETKCCDDIAMNLLVAYHTGLPPILIRAPGIKRFESSTGKGLSKAKDWTKLRGQTVRTLIDVAFNGTDPLKMSSMVVTSMNSLDPFDLSWIRNCWGLEFLYKIFKIV